MTKIPLLLRLLLFSCLLAVLYGAIHNQISYSVSPGYFHEYKFHQFGFDPVLRNRLGASFVGMLASWWMGIIIGLPIYFVGRSVCAPTAFIAAFFRSALLVVVVTLATGLGALLIAYVRFSADNLPVWMAGWQVADPIAFARAGTMHNFSYLGGVLGLLLGLSQIVWSARRPRKQGEGSIG